MSAVESLSETAPPSRRSRKKEQTRRGIFSAAMTLFSTSDYDTVTIEDICERADVAKATFFLHFPNKAALLIEFNERLTVDLKQRLEGVTDSSQEKLHFVVNLLVEDWKKNADVMRKMVREFMDQPSLHKVATEANAGILDLITDIVKEGQAAGELRTSVAPQLIAASLVASWGAFISIWLANPDDFPKTVGEDLLDIMLTGLKV